MATIKVYRNGSLSLGEHSSEVQQAWTPYDTCKPAERSGRLSSLYASPSLAGVTRWVKGNHLVNGHNAEADLTTHEITVLNPEEVFVYSITAYDAAYRSHGVNEEKVQAYWESGIRLTEWSTTADEMNLDASEWEVLLPVENVTSSKVVSDTRLLNSVTDAFSRDQLKSALKDRKRRF